MILADVPRGHVVITGRYPAFVMSQVTFARAGPPSFEKALSGYLFHMPQECKDIIESISHIVQEMHYNSSLPS